MSNSYVNGNGQNGLVLTVLGCGTMGVAILSGVLSSLTDPTGYSAPSTPSVEMPKKIPTRFIACVRRADSAKRVNAALSAYSIPVTVYINDNIKAVQAADIVLLGCKPQMFRDVLGEKGMREALQNKFLISILAGVTVHQIEQHLYGDVSSQDPLSEGRCRIVRVMPNTAAAVRESMTVIGNPTPPLDEGRAAVVEWIFTKVGRVVWLPPSALDASTALCGSGPAFMALVLEAIADGAVAMGLPRAEAQTMAAQTMRGTTGMVLKGEHPAILRDKVSTPGGCTIGGLLVLEEGRVRGVMSRAVREATTVASKLGQGEQGVNSPR